VHRALLRCGEALGSAIAAERVPSACDAGIDPVCNISAPIIDKRRRRRDDAGCLSARFPGRLL